MPGAVLAKAPRDAIGPAVVPGLIAGGICLESGQNTAPPLAALAPHHAQMVQRLHRPPDRGGESHSTGRCV